MARKIYYSDHLEESIGNMLLKKGIKFIHESEHSGIPLDFYLPNHNLYIEVKQFHAMRIERQMSLADNVIVLQGKRSVEFFNNLLNK